MIRHMYAQYKSNPDPVLLPQIENLKRRVRLIRDMQFLGVMSLFMWVLCMFLLFRGNVLLGKYVFAGALLLAGPLHPRNPDFDPRPANPVE
jgi:hypothetical protein